MGVFLIKPIAHESRERGTHLEPHNMRHARGASNRHSADLRLQGADLGLVPGKKQKMEAGRGKIERGADCRLWQHSTDSGANFWKVMVPALALIFAHIDTPDSGNLVGEKE